MIRFHSVILAEKRVQNCRVLSVIDRDGKEFVVYNRSSKSLKILRRMSGDEKGNVPFYYPQAILNNEVISILDPGVFLDEHDRNSREGKNFNPIKDIVKGLDLNDPPVLVRYKLQ